MKHLLLILFLLLCTRADAQYKPKHFNAFDGKKELVFEENFDDDRNGWLENDTYSVQMHTSIVNDNYIKHGLFHIYNTGMRPNTFISYHAKTTIDYSRNFEIVLNARITGKDFGKDIGILYWGKASKDLRTGYQVYFANNGDFRAFYSNAQIEEYVHPDINKFKTAGDTFSTKDYNRYTIRHYKNRYYLFLNGSYRGSMQSVPLPGKLLGLGASANAMGLFDSVHVYYLP